MSALLKLGSAFFGGSLTSLSLFKKQSFAEADCQQNLNFQVHQAKTVPWKYNWDKRQDQVINGVKPTGVRNLFFIRHGQYKTLTPFKFLSDLGIEQAVYLGRFLKQFKDTFDLEQMEVKIYTSPMNRAKQTCKIAMEYAKLDEQYVSIEEPRLEEGCPIYPDPPFDGWDPNIADVANKRTELNEFFKEHMHRSSSNKDSFELYFCHGNIIRFLTLKLLQLPLNAWSRFDLHHCSITWFRIFPNGKVSCLTYGDAGFLDVEKCTYD